MAVVCVILDSQPPYLRGSGGSPNSLLSLPLACDTIAGKICASLREVGCSDIRVLPTFEPDAGYAEMLEGLVPGGLRLASAEVVTALVHEYEPSDVLLVLQPRYWRVGGLELRHLLRDMQMNPAAVHGVTISTTPEGTEEYAHCDAAGQVIRITRYFEEVTCSRIDAILYTLVPLSPVLEGIRFVALPELRAGLTQCGMVSRDERIGSGVIDLGDEQGALVLNEQALIECLSGPEPAGYTESSEGVLVGSGCSVDSSAQVVGPVVIQDGARVGAGAMIIGPAVIGAGSVVERGAVVAQSVLVAATCVTADGEAHHRVARGNGPAGTDERSSPGIGSTHSPGPARGDLVRLCADASIRQGIRRMKPLYQGAKRVFDCVAAGLSLLFLSPLLLLTAIVVRIDSRGPVFFGHDREGRGGRIFRCLKFRTMCQDAHQRQRELYNANALDGPQFKLDNDPRVTRVGKWLRTTNIDELPQLFNVFLGQMSLVGPRPSPFRENQICVPWRRARLSVRPGITGLWQICRDQRSEGDFHQWITYDMMYVRNLSLWLDVKILAATVLTLGGAWSVPHSWLVHDAESRDSEESSRHAAATTPA